MHTHAAFMLALSVIVGGCSTEDGNGESSGRAHSETFTLSPGKVHEDCMELTTEEAIEYEFSASAEVAFNIHWHEGEHVEYPVENDAVKDMSGVYKPGVAQTYCLMWTNEGDADVTIEYECVVE